MSYRVISAGTGNTGVHGLRGVIEHPELTLAGHWVYSDDKAGRDAGDLCGLAPTGILASQNLSDLLDLKPDCVLYMKADPELSNPTVPGSWGESLVEEMCQILERGIDVVTTSVCSLTYPSIWGDAFRAKIEAAGRKGGSTFCCIGIEPGFMGDELLLTLSSLSLNIESVRCQEILDYSTYDDAATIRFHGFGLPEPSQEERDARAAHLGAMWCPAVLMTADELGVRLDGPPTCVYETVTTEEDVEVAAGTIESGTVGGIRFEITGRVSGEPRIFLEHITRIRPDIAPQWASLEPGGFRVTIKGDPCLTSEVAFTEDGGNACVQACLGTAARAVNAIPLVCAAPSGVTHSMDLPSRIVGRGQMRSRSHPRLTAKAIPLTPLTRRVRKRLGQDRSEARFIVRIHLPQLRAEFCPCEAELRFGHLLAPPYGAQMGYIL